MANILELVISYPDFKLGDVIDPESFDQNNMEMVTKINEIITEFNTHTTAAVLDHPDLSVIEAKLADGAVTDVKIGNRTVNQAIATASANTGTLTQLLSWIVKEIKAIKGSVTNWYDSGAATISAIWAKFNASTGHKHTGAANDAPKLIAGDIMFTPSGTITASDVQTAIGKLDGDIVAHKMSGDHDGRYYTEAEIDNALSILDSNLNTHKTSADHDGRYYTENEIDTFLVGKSDISHTHTAADIGALISVAGITNPGGDVNLVGGTGILISTNPETKEVTITATTEAIPGAHSHTIGEVTNLTENLDFLALVQKHYKNINLAYNYTTLNGEKVISSIDITGDITATITYNYTGTDNKLESEVVNYGVLILTTTYSYDVNGNVISEQRVVTVA